MTRIRIIDAFTDRPFSGNPAAVCLLGGGQWPDERWMRQVAMEMSLSQTAFARPLRDDAGAGYDFVSRFFSPADGIPEDPVTGSAHTALSPFWAGRLGRREVTGFQASARGGFVRTRLDRDRVRLSGHARTVLDGRLLHSPLPK